MRVENFVLNKSHGLFCRVPSDRVTSRKVGNRILSKSQSLRGEDDIPLRWRRRVTVFNVRYFKRVMLTSEANGRISELRSKGYQIETSKVKDVNAPANMLVFLTL